MRTALCSRGAMSCEVTTHPAWRHWSEATPHHEFSLPVMFSRGSPGAHHWAPPMPGPRGGLIIIGTIPPGCAKPLTTSAFIAYVGCWARLLVMGPAMLGDMSKSAVSFSCLTLLKLSIDTLLSGPSELHASIMSMSFCASGTVFV